MAIEVTDDLVEHIAKLSRLAISREEARGIRQHFEKILTFIAEFQALDTRDVDPSNFSVDSSNVYREDSARPSLDRAAALSNAPQADGTYFIVPRIVGGAAGGASAAEVADEGGGAA